MPAASVFSCLTGPCKDCLPTSMAVVMANCTESAKQQWLFPLADIKSGALQEFAIAFANDMQTCLGATEAGVLVTRDCSGGKDFVLWEYSLQAPRSNFLVQKGTAKCLKWIDADGVPPGSVMLEDCPISPDNRFAWIPVAVAKLIPDAELPLRVHRSNLVGQSGRAVRLRGVNWYGSHMEQLVNNGLSQITVEEMARLLKNLGFNVVRMMYSTQALFQDERPNETLLRANPKLVGMRAMEVFHYLVESLTAAGLLVIINNHVTETKWCCTFNDGNSLWFNSQWTELEWLEGLSMMAATYRYNRRVIGIDLRNEPRDDQGRKGHNDPPHFLWWGSFIHPVVHGVFAADWRAAATEGAKTVWHANPEAIVFVEGLFGGIDLSLVWQNAMTFNQECLQSRVAYSVHAYSWTEATLKIYRDMDFRHFYRLQRWRPNWEALQDIYHNPASERLDVSWHDFRELMDASWGYLRTHDLGVVWVGEFGTDRQSSWWKQIMRYLSDKDLDWTYWAIDGLKYPQSSENESFGILSDDYKALRSGWKMLDLAEMLASSGVQQQQLTNVTECAFDPRLDPVVGDSWWRNRFLLRSKQQVRVMVVAAMFCMCCGPGCVLIGCCCCYERARKAMMEWIHRTDGCDSEEETGSGKSSTDEDDPYLLSQKSSHDHDIEMMPKRCQQ